MENSEAAEHGDIRRKMINLVFFGLPELEDVLSLDEPLKQRLP